jgi:hypothetical protein
MIPIRRGESVPHYQQVAIVWLKRFKNTELLQQMLARFRFSELEIAAYRNNWSEWLRPKPDPRNQCRDEADPCGTGMA